LKKSIADENASKESKLKDLNDQGKQRSDMFQQRHNDRKAALDKRIQDLETSLNQVRTNNKNLEEKLRGEYKKAENNY